MSGWDIIHADVFEGLARLEDESVQCVVTSPPYWHQRDYGVEGQIGLEESPWEYLETLVRVFAEVRRVLRRDGTAWVNMGDSYCTRPNGNIGRTSRVQHSRNHAVYRRAHARRSAAQPPGLKHKDLIGMPWRLALALQEAGWWLRSCVVWQKPTPMPESCRDRPTTAHEYMFLLTRSAKYHYDAEAIKEPTTGGAHGRGTGVNPKARIPAGWDTGPGDHRDKVGRYPRSKQNESFSAAITRPVSMRNKQTVWTVQSAPFPGAHFATFPPKLVEPCILAGTTSQACAECGAPVRRVVARQPRGDWTKGRHETGDRLKEGRGDATDGGRGAAFYEGYKAPETVGWEPDCICWEPGGRCLVLDPFAGSGTTGMVAIEHGCDFVGIELNQAYAEMARGRLAQAARQGRIRFK